MTDQQDTQLFGLDPEQVTFVAGNDELWHSLRAAHGGSSEAPALFDYGYQNCPSQWTLWALKMGKLNAADLFNEDDDRIWYGKELENLTAKAVARKMSWEIVDAGIYVEHPDKTTHMGSTVDRYVLNHEDGPGILECKNRDYIQWVENYTEDDASMRDKIQLAHQFACHPNIKWGAVAVLVGGNTLKVYPYQRASLEDQIKDIEEYWRTFWQSVAQEIEPSLTGVEIPNWLSVHQEQLGEIEEPIELPESLDEVIAIYQTMKETAKNAEKMKKDCQAKILQAMEERTSGISNAYRVKVKYAEIAAATIERKESIRTTITIKDNTAPASDRAPDPDATSDAVKDAAFKAQAPLDA